MHVISMIDGNQGRQRPQCAIPEDRSCPDLKEIEGSFFELRYRCERCGKDVVVDTTSA